MNEYAFIWAITTLTNLGVDSNSFTAVLDFNNATVSSTNHCTIGSVSLSGLSLTISAFHADHQAPAFYVPDGTTTNDMRQAFVDIPAFGNAFCEIIRITNAPTGTYNVQWDNYPPIQVSSAQLASGFNWWTNYANPFFYQGMSTIYAMCDMRDVLRTDSSNPAHGGAGLLLSQYESYARAVYPTNFLGVDNYIAQGDMVARESSLQTQDATTHATTQQTNHTLTVSWLSSLGAANVPAVSGGVVHWGQ
jgi:hypothetical protein